MAMSAFQKVTLATCLVLCVALLLPKMLLSRGRKEAAERPDGPGHYPPMMHRQMSPDSRGPRAGGPLVSRAHNPEAIARAKGGGTGAGAGGGKSNLAGQIIPVYGFGILLYILYILFKITSKCNNKPAESRCQAVGSENMKRKISDFELAQLQEKLRETELVMEDMVSTAQYCPSRVNGAMAAQEENLLQQLTEITRVMQEGHMVEEMEVEKREESRTWEDYPEEPQQYWRHSHWCCHNAEHSEEAQNGEEMMEAQTGAEMMDVQTGMEMMEASRDHAGDGAPSDMSEDVVDRGGVREQEAGPKREREDQYGREEEQGGTGLLEEEEQEKAGDLQELELTLETLGHSAERENPSGTVRRRSRRRRARKDSH